MKAARGTLSLGGLDVRAWLWGHTAVHPSVGRRGWWSVTHLRSGAFFADDAPSRSAARALAEELESAFGETLSFDAPGGVPALPKETIEEITRLVFDHRRAWSRPHSGAWTRADVDACRTAALA